MANDNLVHVLYDTERAWVRVQLDSGRGNVISDEVVEVMRATLQAVRDRKGIKLVSFEAIGPDFSFGTSVREHAPDVIRTALPRFHQLIRDLLDLPVVTAAVVHGRCFGGGFELALACDTIIAAEESVLGLPEIALGLFPPIGAVLLPLRVGVSRATRAVMSGTPRSAAAWRAAGLLQSVVPHEFLMQTVEGWYDEYLAPRSAVALQHAAVASRMVFRHVVDPLIDKVERFYLDQLMTCHDPVEGVTAFLEKRKPIWTDV